MASTERSLGWATSGTGDGPAGGYDSSRWRANAQKSDGTGITLYGSDMAMSGTATSTLTIADGAAIINGYTYETNGSVTISTTGLSGTYSVVLVANNTAGTVTVTANGAGTTTVAASTIRAVIATAAQVTTITTAVGTANVITIGSISIAAGVISSITPAYPYSTGMQLPPQVYGVMDSPGINAIANATATTITGYGITATSGDGIITLNSGTGVFTVSVAGLYQVHGLVQWDTNTTGSRILAYGGTGFTYTPDVYWQPTLATTLAYAQNQQSSGIIGLSAGATIYMYAQQNSGTSRQVLNANFKLVRL